jgi:hypothetical protein
MNCSVEHLHLMFTRQKSHNDGFGIESDSSFVGYIDGVHSFHKNTSKPPGGSEELTVLQVDGVEEYHL